MKYEVWSQELGGEECARLYEADDAERAAANWAYREDAYSNEYLIANGHSMEVCVRAPGSRDVLRFMVHGRLQRVYSANAIPRRTAPFSE